MAETGGTTYWQPGAWGYTAIKPWANRDGQGGLLRVLAGLIKDVLETNEGDISIRARTALSNIYIPCDKDDLKCLWIILITPLGTSIWPVIPSAFVYTLLLNLTFIDGVNVPQEPGCLVEKSPCLVLPMLISYYPLRLNQSQVLSISCQ